MTSEILIFKRKKKQCKETKYKEKTKITTEKPKYYQHSDQSKSYFSCIFMCFKMTILTHIINMKYTQHCINKEHNTNYMTLDIEFSYWFHKEGKELSECAHTLYANGFDWKDHLPTIALQNMSILLILFFFFFFLGFQFHYK